VPELTPAITIYTPDFSTIRVIACSPPTWAVLLALEEKRLPYGRRMLSFAEGEHRSPEMLALNPRGTVPVLTDGPRVLYETFAILEYVDWAYRSPPLMPEGLDERALALTRFHESGTLKAVGMDLFAWLMRAPEEARSPERLEGMTHPLHRELTVWERFYSRSTWAAGDALSLADLVVFAYVATAVQLGLDLAEWYPSLTRVYEAMRDRPSARATWPRTWTERLDLL
jgi:glutathione S-transferase